MKGVVLAGGLGTRLWPLTHVTNKCLLPVYNKPMIYFPIQTLVDSGIDDILIVCGGNAAGEFLRILGNGEEFGLKHLHYTYQKEAKGIADALGLAEEWANGEAITVILADNILESPIGDHIKNFEENPVGARIFLSHVEHPEHYGVVEIDDFCKMEDLPAPWMGTMVPFKVKGIEEKPENPKSSWAAIGLYIYDETVWDFIKRLKPSARNELEITDVNRYYLETGRLEAHKLHGWWADAGESFTTYLGAAFAVCTHEAALAACTQEGQVALPNSD